ncbi:hypothetical protein BCR33DRAFT_765810 [Rhizoclosmatium globosum]|uniref:RRM domain-containing protein n=1 Tax=Rhizoclosmatium globosum TaxID=329046 RepID=A0A1Y2CCX5_9FUNG|nr:hypothetical protein BCR33DRAFT_765810 [Rhizoclosmatium globosum]|eukprot:ORY44757.1 hypothetical protein BCR33DRAFT_765810 [Rhizoclosmatium globosum]
MIPPNMDQFDPFALYPQLSHASNDPDEEISTIFVVGLPEDMQEREFQNMFIFAPGFESATLQQSINSDETYNNKSVIGLAKFRTRNEANYARDSLNGRVVDNERGCILKAEIANKNLLIKRNNIASHTSANGIPTPCDLTSQFTVTQQKPNQQPSALYAPLSATTSPVLLENGSKPQQTQAPNLSLRKIQEFQPSMNSAFNGYTSPVPWDILNEDVPSEPLSSSFNTRRMDLRINTDTPSLLNLESADTSTDKNMTTCRNSPTGLDNEPLEILTAAPQHILSSTQQHSLNFPSRTNSIASAFDHDDGVVGSTGTAFVNRVAFRVCRQLEHENGGGFNNSNNGCMVNGMYAGGGGNMMQQQQQFSNCGGMPSVNMYGSMGMNGTGGGFNGSLPTPASIAAAGYRCPADQNPPCNTLYVGNLPVHTSEVELRELFSRCMGYRRMSFRMRMNGPMVFVEFDSIPYAQQALSDLHGTLLSNSVKGGIRLSFSKNPLGVRPTQTYFNQNGSSTWGCPLHHC